jgi:hypothetical protein
MSIAARMRRYPDARSWMLDHAQASHRGPQIAQIEADFISAIADWTRMDADSIG